MNDEELDRQLDRLSQTRKPAPDYLAPRILANVPAREPIEVIFGWFSAALWRPVAAAMLPLLLGFIAGTGNVEDTDTWYEAEALVFVDVLEEYDYDEI